MKMYMDSNLSLFTSASSSQAADLLHLPLDYAAAGSCMAAFVAVSVAIAFLTGNAGQRPVGEEEIY